MERVSPETKSENSPAAFQIIFRVLEWGSGDQPDKGLRIAVSRVGEPQENKVFKKW